MAANMAAPPLGDLPWLENARGGSRDYTREGADNTVVNMFHRTSQATSDRENDFVALRKAAMAGHHGVKKSQSMLVLPGEGGEVEVIDARKMGREANRDLVDRVMKGADNKDNYPLLVGMQERMARVGMCNPTIVVRYREMSVLVRLTVGDRTVPSLTATVSRRVEPLMRTVGRGARRTDFAIIERTSGIIRPGVFTLLLGPPGSGKSTFLKALAGQHTKGSHIRIHADELSYNGLAFNQFHVARSAAYISQVDTHYGELTVRETMEFSARCQSSGYNKTLLEELLRREEEMGVQPDPSVDAYMRAKTFGSAKSNLIVELIIRLLGLDVCADTVVGNQMLRGISGGQKKRVTTGEMIVGPVKALFADEISTGLDSNTTFQICKGLKNFTHVMQATVLVGLLQPQPETYDLFDEVILLSSGQVCYHGPREAVLPFFDQLGFYCPERRGVADFLQEVTTPSDQQKYWKEGNGRPYRFVTARMFEDAYHGTECWQGMEAELATPFGESGPCNEAALAKTKYGQNYGELLRANFRRVWTLTQRTKFFAIFRIFQVALMAFVVATLFWRADKNTVDDGNLFMGVLFYSQLYMLLGGLAEMHLLIERLAVFFRQRDIRFYPGWCFAVPAFLLRVPFGLVEATLWTYIVYFIVGFSGTVRVLMFWFLLFLQNIWSTSLFQTIAMVCRNDTVATAFGSFFMLVFFNTGGFVLNRLDIPPWWIGAYWANPFGWVTRALAINEFTAGHWQKPNPADPSSSLGDDVLGFRGFPTAYWWVWAAVGFIIASTIINVLAFVAGATFLPAPHAPGVISPELLEEFQMSRAPRAPSVTDTRVRPDVEAKKATSPKVPNPGGRVVEAYPVPNPEDGLPLVAGSGGSGGEESASADTPRTPASPQSPATTPVTNPRPLPGTTDTYWEPVGAGAGAGAAAAPTVGGGEIVLASKAAAKSGATVGAIELVSRADSAVLPYGPDTEWVQRGSFILRASQRASFSQQQAHGYRQRTAIPYDPLAMTFKDVTYSVPLPKDADRSRADVGGEGPHAGQLRLLKAISGVFRPGVLTALMGASGAGKTTLMDVLAGRKTGGAITGEVNVNGFPKDQKTFARVMGYVEQTDIHLPQTTVEEACHFSARLRLPTTVDVNTRKQFVEEMMSVVELNRLRHAYVGVPGVSGLSVEQRKRLTMAVELVANPSIVFMDEPTSGLDARAAGIVMSAVRNTVDTGRTVVCTIHQPSIDIFEAFDELLLLKPGGRTIYFGPIGDHSQRLIDYFQGIQGVAPIKPRENAATWMLEISNPGHEAELGLDLSEVYGKSDLAREMLGVMEERHKPAADAKPLDYSELHVASAPTQFLVNLQRFFRMYWRSPEYNLTRYGITLLVGFVFGSLFWRLGDNRTTVAGVFNIMGVLYSSTLFVGISNCLSVQHVVAVQRAVMYRERAAGTYGVLPFSLAQQLVEIPYILVQSIVYCAIVYWMIWFARDAAKFFWFLFYFFLTLSYFTFFGVMNTCLTPTVAFANVLSSFFFGFFNLLSGFIIPQPFIPGWWIWAFWANPVMWTLYGMIVSQLGDYTNEYITDLNGNTMTIPDFLVERFFFKHSMLGPIVAILCGYVVTFCLVSGLALKRFNFQNR